MTVPTLQVEGLTKVYPGVVANDDITMSVERGEVMAVLGENGAGKSTLMKAIFGLTTPDSGRVVFCGEPVSSGSSRSAAALGLAMVSQELMLVDRLTVAENVALGADGTLGSRWYGHLEMSGFEERIRELSEHYGWTLDPQALVGDLPIGVRQRVEIIKALYRGVDLIILDEPTTVLTPDERDSLFALIEQMRSEGRAVLFISHKLEEALRVADRVTVLRRGRVVARRRASDTDARELSRLMVGEDLTPETRQRSESFGGVGLELRGVRVSDETAEVGLRDVDLNVHFGEIFGVAGVEGNGQTALAEVIAGLRESSKGSIHVAGQDVTSGGARERFEAGVGFVAADRRGLGLVEPFTVAENLALKSFRQRPFSRRGIMHRQSIAATSEAMIDRFDIRIPDATSPTGVLSGGGLQRVILARELGVSTPQVLVAMHPARGLDVKSERYVHDLLVEQRTAGAAIVLISADLDELLTLSDTIAVLYEGAILDSAPRSEITMAWLAALVGGRDPVSAA